MNNDNNDMNHDDPESWSAHRTPRSRLFFAAFLILAGTVLFLGNLGILPIHSVWSYWPLIIVILGLFRMTSASDLTRRLFGALVAFVGALFLLINLDLLHIRTHDGSWPVSILLIVLGMVMLIKVLDKRTPEKTRWAGFYPPQMADMSNGLTDFTFMGSLKRRIETNDFRGGRLLSVLGNIELDLRHARIAEPGQTVQLEISAILGAAKIRVPEIWRIQIHGASILGNYEDKTIPPTAGADAPTLLITGFSFMSSVEIED